MLVQMGTRVVALVLLVVFVAGCSSERSARPEAASSPGTASVSPTPANRPVVTPDRLIVENDGFGRSKGRVAQAIADLKEVGLWQRLTRRLYAVKFGSRPGETNIPDDGHLADAFLTVRIDGDFGGAFCDVMFFPRAIIADLDRWELYHSQGLMSDPAPTIRQFWASIMAHELAHCFKGRNGEPIAMEWEDKALQAVRDAGLE